MQPDKALRVRRLVVTSDLFGWARPGRTENDNLLALAQDEARPVPAPPTHLHSHELDLKIKLRKR